jgi:hypothetical protein
MSGWNVLDTVVKAFPPLAAALLLVAAAVVFIVGFSRRGLNFVKYGFGKIGLDETLEKRFDRLEERLDGMDNRIAAIETNHFGHLKNYLGVLNGILLDKGIIDNEGKARLDNELRGM